MRQRTTRCTDSVDVLVALARVRASDAPAPAVILSDQPAAIVIFPNLIVALRAMGSIRPCT